jgi:hypothetical protein
MKKTLIIGALCVGAVSAYSQGTVNFYDRQTDMTIHIYAPQLATPSVETTGMANSAVGVTADILDVGGNITTGGSTVYTGGAIGNTATANQTAAGAYHYNNGSDYTVELYAAPGLNAASSALQPVSQYQSTVYTSATLGGAFKSLTVATDPGIPSTLPSGQATIALVAWYNGGVNIPTASAPISQTILSAQLAADEGGAGPYGISPLDSITGLGGSGSPPAATPDMLGLQSFSLVTTPEPSTIALGVIGASSLLFRRRK